LLWFQTADAEACRSSLPFLLVERAAVISDGQRIISYQTTYSEKARKVWGSERNGLGSQSVKDRERCRRGGQNERSLHVG
jgi:hypothetical protein